MSETLKYTRNFRVNQLDDGFEVFLNDLLVLRHTYKSPMVFIGQGQEHIEMYRGNFDIQDYLVERIALRYVSVDENEDSYIVGFSAYPGTEPMLKISLRVENDRLTCQFSCLEPQINRIWLRVTADKNEKVYGCGEQLSYFNMRGKNFPLWTSEPGVGRNKQSYVTWLADIQGKAGGDYYNTNFPQPTYVSSRKYYCHVETTAYADFDFRNNHFHELQIWDIPKSIWFETADNFVELAARITAAFGRQPELPDWTYNGIWLGIQGGTEVVEQKLEYAISKGVKVGAVWCQDWQGERITSFGKRLMWDWKWNSSLYPHLDTKISLWKSQGICFLGYINPYVASDGELYKTAAENGYLGLNENGEVYLVDFGEFDCGVVDFTNPDACAWYKKVIQENLIEFGLDGWMADFGEYLPTDLVLHNGESAMLMHNAWPVMWARINYEAVQEAGKLGQVVYFMRAGYTGTQKYCTLLWAGDQSVDWSLDDGIASAIPAALSAGMVGCGLHHSDIGGYTSLHGMKRTKELFMRWAELAAFTPVMRTHEGNRPYDCFQFDGDDESLEHLARMTSIYVDLSPYTKSLVKGNAETGLPVQRPLFMHYEDDEVAYDLQYQYLYGRDLLIAPVYRENTQKLTVYLPDDSWIHLWSGQKYAQGYTEVDTPIGFPAVFYREKSEFVSLFREILDRYGSNPPLL